MVEKEVAMGINQSGGAPGLTNGKMVEAVLVAAGSSSRMGFDKLNHRIGGTEVVLLAFRALEGHPEVDRVVVVAGENLAQVRELIEGDTPRKPVAFVRGGDSRAASVAAGVALCDGASLIAIHDAARPFVSEALISRVLRAAGEYGAAAPALPVKDTIKQVEDSAVVRTLPRAELAGVQTPQAFDGAVYKTALAALPQEEWPNITDDCMVMERAGRQVHLVEGDEANYKITTPADLERQGTRPALPRIGHGYDVHAFAPARRLILGGVDIPYELGLAGHSDADVLAHAVSDALLGALALGDIGKYFPDTDPAYKGADSLHLLDEVGRLLRERGWIPGNIDATIVCQAPKLAPHIPAMRKNIARVLGLPEDAVSVKATTEEHLGFTGRGEGIAAHCVVLIQPK